MAETSQLDGVGAWHLMPKPKAFRHGDTTYMGWVNEEGELGVSTFDHNEKELNRSVIVDDLDFVDDHSAPGIFRRDDGHLIAMWSPRGSPYNDDSLRWHISENPDDISSWGDAMVLEDVPDDYPQIVEWDGNIRVYYRANRGEKDVWDYLESTDGLETEGNVTVNSWITGEEYQHIHDEDNRPGRHRIYVGIAKEERDGNDRLHMAFGGYRQALQAVRHFYLEDGEYFDSHGNAIGVSDGMEIDDWTPLTTVWEGTEDHYTDSPKLNSMAAKDGNVYLTFQDIKLVAADNTDGHPGGDYRGRWAKYDGQSWTVGSEVVDMGPDMSTSGPAEGVYHKGSFELDPENPTTVFSSVHVGDDNDDRRYQIKEFETTDEGQSWTHVQDLSDDDVVYGLGGQRGGAMAPKNHDGEELRVIWWEGKHDRYNDFSYQIMTEEIDSSKTLTQNGNVLTINGNVMNVPF